MKICGISLQNLSIFPLPAEQSLLPLSCHIIKFFFSEFLVSFSDACALRTTLLQNLAQVHMKKKKFKKKRWQNLTQKRLCEKS